MTHVSIIGTGNMGQAIAAVAGRGGHAVQLLGQDDHGTEVSGPRRRREGLLDRRVRRRCLTTPVPSTTTEERPR